MCVISLAKLRSEEPEKLAHLIDQMKKSKIKKELSIDIIDYMCTCAAEIDLTHVQTAFGVREIADMADTFNSVSLDSF